QQTRLDPIRAGHRPSPKLILIWLADFHRLGLSRTRGAAALVQDEEQGRAFLTLRSPRKTEGEGFEPSTSLTTRNGFRDRRIRPLCHPSGSATVPDRRTLSDWWPSDPVR